MRLIDAERLRDELLWGNVFLTDNEIDALVDLIDNQPTIFPLNDPLTLDELRAMVGQPVWTVGVSFTDDGKWEMWDIVEGIDKDGITFGYSTESREWWNYNLRDEQGNLLGCAWTCYRQPPKEVQERAETD